MNQSGVIVCCVYALVLLVTQGNASDGQKAVDSPSEGQLGTYVRVAKRETTGSEGLGDGCPVVSRPQGSGEKYIGQVLDRRFFFRPGPEFKRMVFRMRLENTLTTRRSFQVVGGLVFDAGDLVSSRNTSKGGSPPEDGWFLVQVEDFKLVRKWGRDRNALRVTINGLTKELITKYWWSVNRYRGFDLYAKGKSLWTFDCDPRSHCSEGEGKGVQLALVGPLQEVSHVWCWTIIGVLLFVLMVVFALLLFVLRRSSASDSSPQQEGLGKDFMVDKLPPKSTDDQPSKASNLYVVSPTRPRLKEEPSPLEDEHLYAEISEASFVAWSTQMSEKYLESVSLGPKVAQQ